MNKNTENNGTDYHSSFTDVFKAVEKGTVEDVKYFVETKGIDVNQVN